MSLLNFLGKYSNPDISKLAHNMKIPPKTVFSCQIVASIWAVL